MQRVVIAHPSPDLYGSDRMLIESVRALTETAEVTVVLPADGPLTERLRPLGAEVVIMPTPVLRKALLRPAGLVRLAGAVVVTLPRMVAWLRRARPSAVYVNTITIPFWIAAARLARVRVVCHAHEAEQGGPRLLRRLLVLPARFAHHTIANSGACLATLTDGGVPARRGTVVYNGVPAPETPSPARAEPAGRLVLVGRLSPRKGGDVAIRAVAELRRRGHDVTLTLVGAVFPGYEWYEDELRGLAAETEGVVFAGFQDPVSPFMDDADIVLVPSLEEPFGNVAVEGMLARRPVVASGVQGLREIVEPGVNGVLVPPGDPGALAGAVEALLRDWPEAVAMAERGRADAEARFTLERYRAEILQVVLGNTPNTPYSHGDAGAVAEGGR
ncbi:glycosyltransferase family 4 protein [Sphaerisporangium sp. TRM90804]|uniref:glycosyltransferase family 4 protein n=1 Tax=Sphaerisporangium sp. TRM90804 TaxID=3031113 RepID=UPI00244C3269|nr:glycosyltransferase family 4 protein [Sphaerisporangium sp. TRM90804]MDH2428933.1 glycosyltransferase family 4 protein [Sphaerisporangium sp. TRM90804]